MAGTVPTLSGREYYAKGPDGIRYRVKQTGNLNAEPDYQWRWSIKPPSESHTNGKLEMTGYTATKEEAFNALSEAIDPFRELLDALEA